MKNQLINFSKSKVSDLDIPESIFGIKFFPDIISQYIRYQNFKSRQGSHKTKTRSEVKGKSKKPFAQKGTGNARQGSSKPPHFRGGAISMGVTNRDYSIKLNKKERNLALKSALSIKLSQDKVFFIDNYVLKTHKTKDLYKSLSKFDFNSALFIHAAKDENVNFLRASSNLPNLSTLIDKGLNVKDLITYDIIFIEKESLEQITKRLSWIKI